MEKSKLENIKVSRKKKLNRILPKIQKENGYFDVFKLGSSSGKKAKTIPCSKGDYYKIMFATEDCNITSSTDIPNTKKQALLFSNPQNQTKLVCPQNGKDGYVCIFNKEFFHQFGNIKQYSVFKPGGIQIFQVSNQQVEQITNIYDRMFEEISSDYIHKNDVLKNLVFELIHLALKMKSPTKPDRQQMDANKRISKSFTELLEQQFPIDKSHDNIQLRTASDFADRLAVHVNHLNRTIKTTTGKTTTQVIANRILKESKILLNQDKWNISEISFALGFTEVTHFNNFFKKHTGLSPTKFKTNSAANHLV